MRAGILDMLAIHAGMGTLDRIREPIGSFESFGAWLAEFLERDPMLAEARRKDIWPGICDAARKAV